MIGVGIEAFDVMVFRVAAAMRKKLVMLEPLEEMHRHVQAGHRPPWTGRQRLSAEDRLDAAVVYASVHRLTPKSKVIVSPLATVKVEP